MPRNGYNSKQSINLKLFSRFYLFQRGFLVFSNVTSLTNNVFVCCYCFGRKFVLNPEPENKKAWKEMLVGSKTTCTPWEFYNFQTCKTVSYVFYIFSISRRLAWNLELLRVAHRLEWCRFIPHVGACSSTYIISSARNAGKQNKSHSRDLFETWVLLAIPVPSLHSNEASSTCLRNAHSSDVLKTKLCFSTTRCLASGCSSKNVCGKESFLRLR
jgi:hypothetical protein